MLGEEVPGVPCHVHFGGSSLVVRERRRACGDRAGPDDAGCLAALAARHAGDLAGPVVRRQQVELGGAGHRAAELAAAGRRLRLQRRAPRRQLRRRHGALRRAPRHRRARPPEQAPGVRRHPGHREGRQHPHVRRARAVGRRCPSLGRRGHRLATGGGRSAARERRRCGSAQPRPEQVSRARWRTATWRSCSGASRPWRAS